MTGSVIGPILITAIAESLRRLEDVTLLYGLSQIILAALFIVIIVFRPGGLMGDREINFGGIWQRLRSRGAAVQGDEGTESQKVEHQVSTHD